MSDFDDFKALCRADLMQVETAIVKTYTTHLAKEAPYAAIDGGAHTGYHCTRIAKFDACQRVMAVEADPWTVLKLREKVALLDEGPRSKIVIVEKAVQEDEDRDAVQWMSSSSHPGRSGVSSIWQNDKAVEFRETRNVQATTLDKLAIEAGQPVKLVKLDLEGGDFMAIKGGAKLMRRDRPLMVFENSNRAPGIYGFTIGDVAAFFEQAGYRAITFGADPATESNWFQFWEMWAAPIEDAERLATRLREVVAAALSASKNSPAKS